MNPILPDSEPELLALGDDDINPSICAVRSEDDENAMYIPETGKSCPTEILRGYPLGQCGGQTDMEAHAYAAYLPYE